MTSEATVAMAIYCNLGSAIIFPGRTLRIVRTTQNNGKKLLPGQSLIPNPASFKISFGYLILHFSKSIVKSDFDPFCLVKANIIQRGQNYQSGRSLVYAW